MTKVGLLNQAELFMSESYFSQLHGYAHNETRKIKVLYLGRIEKTNSGKDLNNIEIKFAEGKQKSNSLKIKLQKH